MKYQYAVFIGRFQPFHLGHLSTVTQALEQAEKLVIVLGSSNAAPNIKNPFTPNDREVMIRQALPSEFQDRISFTRVRDYLYDDSKWVTEVDAKVHDITGYSGNTALIGYHKDDSTYYLDLFPQWSFIHATPKHAIDATNVRQLYFEGKGYRHLVPGSVADNLEGWKIHSRYDRLCQEYEFIRSYKAAWASAPYDPTFVTVDAVVLQNNHVLVVERKDMPGAGLYALPGGFIKSGERLVDAAIRELKEETNIVFPERDLKEHIVESKVFDHPGRSLRGRTITHAFCIKLKEKSIPRVLGADDAASAKWIPVQDVYRLESQFYEDHGQVVDYFISRL